jgi:sugar O-acyltransferase (sialic acid O-acetyltransferase NeuD family)
VQIREKQGKIFDKLLSAFHILQVYYFLEYFVGKQVKKNTQQTKQNNPKYMYLYGAGGHSKVITDILQSLGIKVLGVFDDQPTGAKLTEVAIDAGIRLAGQEFPQLDAPLIISVGDNARRAELAQMIPATYGQAIHGTAIISAKSVIGEGTVILQGAIVQAAAQVGKHVLINTAASIDHDNVIGDYAHISPHATLCGHVQVGEGTHIGAGAVVIPSVRIGRWCTIGAGAVVIKDIPDFATAVGNPARVIKMHGTPVTGNKILH